MVISMVVMVLYAAGRAPERPGCKHAGQVRLPLGFLPVTVELEVGLLDTDAGVRHYVVELELWGGELLQCNLRGWRAASSLFLTSVSYLAC